MSQSLAQIYVHSVFSTKDRRPALSGIRAVPLGLDVNRETGPQGCVNPRFARVDLPWASLELSLRDE